MQVIRYTCMCIYTCKSYGMSCMGSIHMQVIRYEHCMGVYHPCKLIRCSTAWVYTHPVCTYELAWVVYTCKSYGTACMCGIHMQVIRYTCMCSIHMQVIRYELAWVVYPCKLIPYTLHVYTTHASHTVHTACVYYPCKLIPCTLHVH